MLNFHFMLIFLRAKVYTGNVLKTRKSVAILEVTSTHSKTNFFSIIVMDIKVHKVNFRLLLVGSSNPVGIQNFS